jgi:hypothetical protein
MADKHDPHSRLSGLARQVVARQTSETALEAYVRAAQARGYSANVALEAYRRAGGKIRTQTFGLVWRRLEGRG